MSSRPQCARTGARRAATSHVPLAIVKPARRPRFLPFILTGAVLGFARRVRRWPVFGWFADPTPTVASNYAPSAGVGYLGVIGALLFGLLAAVIAVLVDRRADRS